MTLINLGQPVREGEFLRRCTVTLQLCLLRNYEHMG